jgi:hypothetical protein
MNQAQHKAASNDKSRAHQSAEYTRVNLNDTLTDYELAAIAREKSKSNGSEPERYCFCDELIVNGRRVPCPPGHDCEYVAARSALIFEASRIATERVGDPKGTAALGYAWSKEFNRAMDRLAYNAGLIK